MNKPSAYWSRFSHFLSRWGRKLHIANYLLALLLAAAIASGVGTYFAITSNTNRFGPDPYTVLGFLLVDLVLFLSVGLFFFRKVISAWIKYRKGAEATRLQTRIVLMFSLACSIPTVIVTVFSVLFFNIGIESWFDHRVSTAIEESVAVAEAYLSEHKEVIRADVLAMANDLNREAYDLANSPELFRKVVVAQGALRSLTEAVVFQQNKILAQTELSLSLAFERLPIDVMEKAASGEVVIVTSDTDDKVRALIKLDNFFDTYLLVGRFVDNRVLAHMETTQGAASEYKRLKSQVYQLQIKFAIIFIMVALLLLLGAIVFGVAFASNIARPIGRMVRATERVKAGDLTARVEEGPKNDEVATLARAFNRMTTQLDRQRSELIEANRQIEARRYFNETVLSGVSAGVIALDKEKRISMVNPSARMLLSVSSAELVGQDFAVHFPEMAVLISEEEHSSDHVSQAEITIQRETRKLVLLVRILAEKRTKDVEGYVITFDDITALVAAQRSAAWADVARRIAHEIKNPLTPIHLAAERLKRKYAKEVSDPEMFGKYTDTITRHVGDIGKIVEEFVDFARMPAPVLAAADLTELVRGVVFSQQCIGSGTEYRLDMPDHHVMLFCDASQITRMIINILKNSEESIEARKADEAGNYAGVITIKIEEGERNCIVTLCDNGRGFPEELIDRLTEPYVTTRVKGTGLGLAIVKKIMEDHNGTVELGNNKEGLAYVRLGF